MNPVFSRFTITRVDTCPCPHRYDHSSYHGGTDPEPRPSAVSASSILGSSTVSISGTNTKSAIPAADLYRVCQQAGRSNSSTSRASGKNYISNQKFHPLICVSLLQMLICLKSHHTEQESYFVS